MKNNTNATKNYLRQALINAPDDFSLQEVKVLIVKAMEAIEEVEKKRQIREDNYQKRKSVQAKKSTVNNLVAIEREINLEKNKLEQLVSKRNSEKIIDAPTNDEEMQNVFG